MAAHRVVLSGLNFGQLHQNVLHFIVDNNAQTPAQLAADVKTNWIDKVSLQQSSSYRWTNILVQNLDEPGVAPFSLVIDRLGQSFNSLQIASFECYVLKFQTARAGRHGRGRSYLGGVIFDAAQAGICTTSFQATFKTQITDHLNAVYAGDNNPRLAVRAHGDSIEFEPVTSIQLRPVIGVQRRRNIGVGV